MYDLELVKFAEVEEISLKIGGKNYIFPTVVRRNHSFLRGVNSEGDGIFILFREENSSEVERLYFGAKEIKEAGLKPRLILWESGGGYSNTGSAQIICGLKGEPLKPSYIRTRGHRACAEHAKFSIWPGNKFIKVYASQWRGDYKVVISEISFSEDDFVITEVVLWEADELHKGDIEEILPVKLDRYMAAVKAAMSKAFCYHCRTPHYIKEVGA
ncbi:MAG: hypothetical protein ACTSRL_22340 [Candidatus Helarchaeota archaeon]